jgi:hypothetical protein
MSQQLTNTKLDVDIVILEQLVNTEFEKFVCNIRTGGK